MKNIIMLLTAVFTLFLAGCGGSSFSYFDGGIITNPYGCRAYWDAGSFPIQVIPDPEYDVEEVIHLAEALTYWNTALGEEVFKLVPVTVLTKSSEAVLVTKAQLGDTILGITRTQYYDNHDGRMGRIHRAMIVIDVDHIASGSRLVHRTIAHELGHALGYYHDPEKKSLMYPKMIGSKEQGLTMTHKVRTYNMIHGKYKKNTAVGTTSCF